MSSYRDGAQRYTTVKQYRIPPADSIDRASVSSARGSDSRQFEETRIIRRERDVTPDPPRRLEREYRYDRDGRREPYELDRYTKTTEYYPTAPRAPVVVPREEDDYQMIRRSEVYEDRQLARRPEPQEEDYYYERRVREVEEDGGEKVRRRRKSSPSKRDYSSDDSMVYVKKREVREDRGGSPHRRRHLAEGAIAGLGAAELLRHHQKSKDGEASTGLARVTKGLGLAAAGAASAEVISRVRSHRSKSRQGSPEREGRHRHRHRSQSRSRSRSRVKTLAGIGLGVAALAAAAGYAKHRSDQAKTPTAEDRRSRSRHRRHSTSEVKEANPKTRMAQAGLAGAAIAGLVERARSKSRTRDGRSRSHNRLKTGLPIAVAGLGTAAIAGLYEQNKATSQAKAVAAEEARKERKARRRSTSRPAAIMPYEGARGPATGHPGLIEYGEAPVYSNGAHPDHYARPVSQAGQYQPEYAMPPPVAAYAPARVVESVTRERVERDRSPSRSREGEHRRRDVSPDSEDGERRRRHHHRRRKSGDQTRERSQSHGRELAAAGLAAGAAALGATQYAKRKERKRAEKEREGESDVRAERNEDAHSHAELEAEQQAYEDGQTYSPASPSAPGLLPAGYPPEAYYAQTGTFPPPPNAAYSPQAAYNPAEYAAPNAPGQPEYGYPPQPGYAPQQGAYSPLPVDPYAPPGRARRGDENVSAMPSYLPTPCPAPSPLEPLPRGRPTCPRERWLIRPSPLRCKPLARPVPSRPSPAALLLATGQPIRPIRRLVLLDRLSRRSTPPPPSRRPPGPLQRSRRQRRHVARPPRRPSPPRQSTVAARRAPFAVPGRLGRDDRHAGAVRQVWAQEVDGVAQRFVRGPDCGEGGGVFGGQGDGGQVVHDPEG
jgi:hypothetical protein